MFKKLWDNFSWVASYFIGVFVGFITFNTPTVDEEILKEYKEIIKICEANLPRNEFCELKALPKQKSMEDK